MKKVRTYIVAILLVIGLLNTLNTAVYAAQYCSITVHTFENQNKFIPVSGVQVTMYRIARPSSDSSKRFDLTQDFIGFTEPLTWDTASDCAELADQLLNYATTNETQGITKSTSDLGQCQFDSLEMGLYLIVQTGEESEKYKTFSPALVELPMFEDNEYSYDADIYPKVDTKPIPAPVTEIPEPSTPAGGGGDVPQTGMLQWPVPILAVAGCLLIITGGYRILDSRKKEK